MTAEEIADFKKNYQKEKFPGLEIPMDQVETGAEAGAEAGTAAAEAEAAAVAS